MAYPSCPRMSPLKRKPSTGEAFTDLKTGMTITVAAKKVRKSRPSGSSTSSCKLEWILLSPLLRFLCPPKSCWSSDSPDSEHWCSADPPHGLLLDRVQHAEHEMVLWRALALLPLQLCRLLCEDAFDVPLQYLIL